MSIRTSPEPHLVTEEPNAGEYFWFGMVHLGLLIASGGVLLASVHIALTGVALAGAGLLFFALRKE